MKFLKNSYEKAKWGQQAIAKACERFRKETQELNEWADLFSDSKRIRFEAVSLNT